MERTGRKNIYCKPVLTVKGEKRVKGAWEKESKTRASKGSVPGQKKVRGTAKEVKAKARGGFGESKIEKKSWGCRSLGVCVCTWGEGPQSSSNCSNRKKTKI